ncbi:Dam family site-specific DNA-(adenine-N6)-methyltransferase, partial [Neisseria sp. P0015.S009]
AFNGLCRYNSKGCFNVPFGRYKSPYFPETEMQAFVQKSERIDLTCSDFQTALDAAEDGDTIYCDPPYAPLSETSSFTSYSKSGFDLDEQKRLAETAKQTARRAHGIL